MKFLIVSTTVLFSLSSLATSLSGTVTVANDRTTKGVLYIFAKNSEGNSRMPVVVKKIESPKFPMKFELTKKDTMVPNTPFKGPFIITARLSPSGGVMDKSGLEAKSKKPVKLGSSSINLILE